MAHKCRVDEETVCPTTGAKVTSQHVNRHCQGTTHQVPRPPPRAWASGALWMHAHQGAALSDQHGDAPPRRWRACGVYLQDQDKGLVGKSPISSQINVPFTRVSPSWTLLATHQPSTSFSHKLICLQHLSFQTRLQCNFWRHLELGLW